MEIKKIQGLSSIIVTFNPSKEMISDLIFSLSFTSDYVWVIDNGSSNSVIESLLDDIPSNCNIVRLIENVGIAKAQNIGIQEAIKNKAKWLVFFDQDSQVPNGLISTLHDNFCKLSELSGENIGAVGPIFKDPRFDFTYPIIKLNKYGMRERIVPKEYSSPFEASFIISSGTLTSVDVISDVGLFKEEFFIDYVDTEWCFRALEKKYKLFVIPSAIMEHTIGDDSIKFLKFKLPVHSPFRRYYRMRNMFFLFKLPYIPLLLKFREFLTNNIHQILIILNSENKKEYLKCWSSAFKDGIKIFLGKYI